MKYLDVYKMVKRAGDVTGQPFPAKVGSKAEYNNTLKQQMEQVRR